MTATLIENGAENGAFDRERAIGDSPFTLDWLLTALEEKDEDFVARVAGTRVSEIDAFDISAGKGFFSCVFKVTISFEDNGAPHCVILKIPGAESSQALVTEDADLAPLHLEDIIMCHNREVYFYNNFAPNLDIAMVKVFKAVEWIPGKQMGCVLMESLTGSGELASVAGNYNRQQLKALVSDIAKLHAHFLVLPTAQWKGKFPIAVYNNPAFPQTVEKMTLKMAEQAPHLFKEGAQKLIPYLRSQKFHDYTICGLNEDVGLPTVLVHGDVWTNNIMLKKNADGSVGNEIRALLDWQLIHDGCVTFDLARLFVVSLDGDIRREIEAEMLEFYFEILKNQLKKQGKEVGFSLDQLKRAYRISVINQMINLLFFTSVFTRQEPEDPTEKRIFAARKDKMYLRAYAALEDSLEYLQEIPADRLL